MGVVFKGEPSEEKKVIGRGQIGIPLLSLLILFQDPVCPYFLEK